MLCMGLPSVFSVCPACRAFRALRVSPSVHDLFPCLCFLEMDLKGDHIAVFGAGDGVSGLEE